MGWENNSVFQVLIITGSTGSGVFVYSPSPGAGNLVASITASAGVDPYGNNYSAGIVSYSGPAPANPTVQLTGANLKFTDNATMFFTNRIGPSAQPSLDTQGPQPGALNQAVWSLFAESSDATKPAQALLQAILLGGTPALPVTGALLEVQGGAGQTALELIPTAGGNEILGTQVSGDTNDRFSVDGNGQHSWGPGNAAVDSQLHRLAANSMSFKTCDLSVETLSRGLRVREGANCKQGTATLAGGTVLVADTAVTASSRIFLTPQDNNTIGAVRVSARVAGTSFTITSSNATDTGVVAYEIFEPA